jgi:hypothetical protein
MAAAKNFAEGLGGKMPAGVLAFAGKLPYHFEFVPWLCTSASNRAPV